ncbi:hypothetical protein AGMMS50293_18840 [Spirochaetia bacterium]|nr:hypothetical protein AGMMS50293_18840 [Spirochaetia bacterium]
MTNNEQSGEITFDTNSGISEEEQREILAKINRISETNRRSLAEVAATELKAGGKAGFKAKKGGGLFPILVNASAVILLGGGFLLLSSFQGKTDLQVREGAKVYNSAERALIDEIRKETASRIEAKENEISLIVSQLEGVDAELQELHSSNQELTAEQRAAEERLKAMQEDFRSNLLSLQDERSRILEDSRAREASLRAQFEARARELAAAAEQSRSALEQSRSALEQSDAALTSARSELERLSGEQEKAAAIEAQLGGSLVSANDYIRKNQLVEAAETLKTMRAFLNTPGFQSIRAIQARSEFYAQAISSLELLIEETRKNQASGGASENADTEKALVELQSQNTQLEETIAGLNKTISALSSQDSGVAERLTELESSVSALRTMNSALEASASAKDETIAALQSEKTELGQTISTRDNSIRELQTRTAAQTEEIATLNTQLNQIRQALQALSQ